MPRLPSQGDGFQESGSDTNSALFSLALFGYFIHALRWSRPLGRNERQQFPTGTQYAIQHVACCTFTIHEPPRTGSEQAGVGPSHVHFLPAQVPAQASPPLSERVMALQEGCHGNHAPGM